MTSLVGLVRQTSQTAFPGGRAGSESSLDSVGSWDPVVVLDIYLAVILGRNEGALLGLMVRPAPFQTANGLSSPKFPVHCAC
jgi:hypothetical protein